MNEEQSAYAIAQVLDQQAAKLPERITERLAGSRAAALAEFTATAPTTPVARARSVRRRNQFDAPSLFQRLAIAGVPAMTLVIALTFFGELSESRRIEHMAELNAAVLLDDLPIAAYADKGFGVYLKNTRQWAALSSDQIASGSR